VLKLPFSVSSFTGKRETRPFLHRLGGLVLAAEASASRMVLTQDLRFTLTILNGATPQPNIVFDLARTDILQNLGLGTSGRAQTAVREAWRLRPRRRGGRGDASRAARIGACPRVSRAENPNL
jgi:hypothetical protein